MSRGRSRNPSGGQPKAPDPRRDQPVRPSDPQQATTPPGATGPGEPLPSPTPPTPTSAPTLSPKGPTIPEAPASTPNSPVPSADKPVTPADKDAAAGRPGFDSSPKRDDAAEPLAAGKPDDKPRGGPVPPTGPASGGTSGKPERAAVAAPPPASGTSRPPPPSGSTPKSPPPAPPSPPPAKSGGGYGAGIVGGVLGGIIGALLVGIGLPLVLGPPPLAPEAAQRVATLETSAAGLEQRLAAAAEQISAADTQLAALSELSSKLDSTVESAVAAAVERIPSKDGAAIAAVGDRLDAISTKVDGLEAAAAAAVDPAPMLAAQAQRLEALQAALTSLDNRLVSEAQRLDAARAETAKTLEASIGDAGVKIEAARQAAQDELEAARTALADDIAAVRSDLETVRTDVTSLEKSVGDMQLVRNRAAAAALLARDIDRSIATGQPFADSLKRLAAMGTGNSEIEATLEALESAAATGVPTIDELRQGLVELDARREPAPIAGSEWLGRTVGNITGLVEVRERDADATSATGVLGEADAALRQGDLEAAMAQVEKAKTMPDGPDPAAIDAWLAKAQARATATAALAQLDAQIRELLTATVN